MEKTINFADENNEEMKYPIGIQTFEKIKTNDFAYVDKTAYVYRLATQGSCYFLSRPRRFGKSLLLSTLKAYFLGQKEMFDGLAISKLEKDWKQYPVLHLDLNAERYNTPEALTERLNVHLDRWEKEYCDTNSTSLSTATRFERVIVESAKKSPQKKVVILIDEYDKPLLEAIGKPELQEEYRQILKAFYSNIKSCDEYIRFAMLTGVTKFSHLSVFSGLNNLIDISMLPQYAEICGISEAELHENFDESVGEIAAANGITKEECYERLKLEYDGYHFSYRGAGMYNPFSLLNVLSFGEFRHYWFATGTPSFLVEVIKHCDYPLDRLTTEQLTATELDAIDAMYSDPIPLFFQSGYLTIKDYDSRFGIYHLDFPNTEVEQGFTQFMAIYYHGGNRNGSFAINKFIIALENGKAEDFMSLLQAFYADGDYQLTGKLEVYFQNSLLIIFKLMGFYVQVERHTSKGRMDVTIQTHDYIYILELKVDKTAEEALQQIEDKQYAAPFATDPRKLFKIGVDFSSEEKGIKEWKIKNE
jgi:hypothetical protein